MARFLIAFLLILGTASTPKTAVAQDLRERCANELAVSSTLSDLCLDAFIMQDIGTSRPSMTGSGIDTRLRQSHVFFPAGGIDLDHEASSAIERIIEVLETRPMRDACLMLEGHSDAIGDEASNLELSLLRAEAVANVLSRRLSIPDRIRLVIGRGEDSALPGTAPNSPLNRRVAVYAQRCRL